jgi:small subunit ribosomal protein S16
MVRIRLRRVGLRNQPSYRIVVADKEAPRDGRFLEIVGFYNPRTEPATIEFDEERIYDWLSKGAQPSEPISRLFKVVNLMDRFKRYKAGEPVDKILADAKAFYDARVVSPRTRRDTAVVVPSKKKAAARAAEAATPKGAPSGEASAESVVKAVDAAAKPVVEAAAEVAAKPVVEAVAEVVAVPVVEAVAEVVAEPVVEEVAEVVAEPVVEAVPEVAADTIEAAAAPESEKVEAPAEITEVAAAEVTEAVEAAPKAKTKKAKS